MVRSANLRYVRLLIILSGFALGDFVNCLPEEDMSVPEIIAYHGYPVEILECTTTDGYILQLHRIPFGRNKSKPFDPTAARPVFFLQHGLLSSSADWVTNLPHQSLGFILADAGYDVWLGNVRGNFYSNRHVNYSTGDRRFWDFTFMYTDKVMKMEFRWDEMSQYDLPAMVETALQVSGQRYLYYVGHSQGTEILFAKLASDPKFGKKIRKFFALAPVSSVGHIRGLIAFLGKYLGGYIWIFKKFFGERAFLPHTWFAHLFATIICGESFMNPFCGNVLFQIGGPETSQFNTTRLMVYMAHTPAGTSTWNILHWAQMYRSGAVQKYDYGSGSENLQHYGQATPPLYNLTLVNVATYLYYSEADWLADADDVRGSLLTLVPKEYLKGAKNLPHFNHFDFIWGLNAAKEVYAEIISAAGKHEEASRAHLEGKVRG